MAETISELRALSDEDLIRRHDDHAPNVQVATGHYLQELYRRDQKRGTEAMLSHTRRITWMTVVITVATLINLGILVISLQRSTSMTHTAATPTLTLPLSGTGDSVTP